MTPDPQVRSAQRVRELDALRGIASLLVMIHHNLLASNILNENAWLFNIFSRTPLQALANGRHAVMFFFVLSGFVLTRALRNFGNRSIGQIWIGWACQRTIRLCLPALASLAISAIIYRTFYAGTWTGEGWWLTERLWQEPPSWHSAIEQGLGIRSASHYEGNNVLWSLGCEWQLSLILPLAASYISRRGSAGAVLILLFALCISDIASGNTYSTIDAGSGLFESVLTMTYFMMPFAIGISLDRVEIIALRSSAVSSGVSFIAVAFLFLYNNDMADCANAGLLIWLAMRSSQFQSVLRKRAFAWLGRVSFSLYLVHELILAPLHHYLHQSAPLWLITTASCIAALPAAELFYILIERPVHRLSKTVGGYLTNLNYPHYNTLPKSQEIHQ